MNQTVIPRVPLGVLTPEGVALVRSWLKDDLPMDLRPEMLTEAPPVGILDNEAYFEAIPGLSMESRVFEDSLDFAKALNAALDARVSPGQMNVLRDSKGFWTAVLLSFVEQFYPADENGKRKRMDAQRYVLGGNSKGVLGKLKSGKPYRHLAWHAAMMSRDYGESADMFLKGKPLYEYTDLIEPILGRTEVRRIGNILTALDYMYWNPEKESFVKGTRSAKKSAGASRKGGLRDAVEVLCQFLRNWDLERMSVAEIVDLLAHEQIFSRHVKRARKRLRAESKVQKLAA